MLPTHVRATLITLLLDVGYWSGVYAADSFLSDHLIRKNQVQNVLEHQPATKSMCDHIVGIFLFPGPSQCRLTHVRGRSPQVQ